MNIEQIKIRTWALKADSTSPGQSLLADAAGIGSLEDPEYIRAMRHVFERMTSIAMNVNAGNLPTDFEDRTVDQYLAARSSKVPAFSAEMRDEELGKGNGHVLSFVRQMKQAIRDSARDTAKAAQRI